MTLTSRSLPLVAYRGLWDKFAAPGTPGSIRRAYLRNVPCVIRATDSAATLNEICAVVADPTVNRQKHPLFLADDRNHPGPAIPLYEWQSSAWTPRGVYVGVRRARTVTAADLRVVARLSHPLVFVESSNVLEARDEALVLNGLTDDDILSALSGIAPSGASFARVSDFIELDFLDRQRAG
jgi:hypothetical protein